MRGGRKSERLKEREIDREREDRSGWRRWWPDRVGLGVEWSGLVAARLAIDGGGQIGQCIGEPSGARPAVGCQDRSSTCTRWCMAEMMREGWVEIFKCVMSMSACEDCL